ncbi:MAG TPA: MBL fold metallo-hydrolase, partial [Solirubrobacteraceae bacterium]|nr:MBL fold metallo-hydrolase [Solirubrobacteraceae bacterium]
RAGAGPGPSPSDAQGWERAAEAGIHRLSVPTPFAVGRVNCYLIEDRPLTLVDTGPNSGKSLDELERALERHGRRIEDLELIVITHQHMDHLGLLEILARRSGAQVAALHLLGPYLANFSASATADDDFSQAVMRRHGIPSEMVTVLAAVGAAFRAFGSRGHIDLELRDGGRLALRDRNLQVLHRPGHSPSDTVLWDEGRGILIGGDHLLARISSNPLISRPLDTDGPPDRDADAGRPRSLLQYLDSLQATRRMPVGLVLPGHGEPILEHVSLIDERLRLHRRRAQKIARMLEAGPMSAYEIALAMWGNVALTQAYLTLSEVLGHLDLLEQEGAVRERETSGTARFELTGSGDAP